jgi:hypothetical protein
MQAATKDKIARLIEQRVFQATKKQVSLKLTNVARVLGKPIISQSVFNNYLSDAWNMPGEDMVYDDNHVYEADEDSSDTHRGWYFDGLKFGINLCVTALVYHDRVVELKATYNGYVVFAEIEGNLKSYAPFPAWEDAVNMFYEGSVTVDRRRQQEESLRKKEEFSKRWGEFWKSFKMLWGY